MCSIVAFMWTSERMEPFVRPDNGQMTVTSRTFGQDLIIDFAFVGTVKVWAVGSLTCGIINIHTISSVWMLERPRRHFEEANKCDWIFGVQTTM